MDAREAVKLSEENDPDFYLIRSAASNGKRSVIIGSPKGLVKELAYKLEGKGFKLSMEDTKIIPEMVAITVSW